MEFGDPFDFKVRKKQFRKAKHTNSNLIDINKNKEMIEQLKTELISVVKEQHLENKNRFNKILEQNLEEQKPEEIVVEDNDAKHDTVNEQNMEEQTETEDVCDKISDEEHENKTIEKAKKKINQSINKLDKTLEKSTDKNVIKQRKWLHKIRKPLIGLLSSVGFYYSTSSVLNLLISDPTNIVASLLYSVVK